MRGRSGRGWSKVVDAHSLANESFIHGLSVGRCLEVLLKVVYSGGGIHNIGITNGLTMTEVWDWVGRFQPNDDGRSTIRQPFVYEFSSITAYRHLDPNPTSTLA